MVFVFKENTYIILPAWSLTYRYRFQLISRWDLSVLLQFHKSDFRKLDAAVFNGYIFIYAVCCVTSATAFFGLEFWKTCFWILEKIIICPLQVPLCISQRKAVNFLQPPVFLLVLCRRIVQLLPGFLIILDFIRKHLVINEPHTPKGLSKHCLLL